MNDRKCRFCQTPLYQTFVDLGLSPVSNAFVKPENVNQGNRFYPLHAFVCEQCLLVQLEQFESPEDIFSQDYVYFSSFSESWLKHAQTYVEMVIDRYNIGKSSKVVEIACNDGYLLQYFIDKNISVLGIEPASSVADEAQNKGIPVVRSFFGTELAKELVNRSPKADLLIGNNVLAHVPDINDFVRGLKFLLNERGVITMEFPHLLRLMQGNQFDTIYHEHFSYFSFLTVQTIFSRFGLSLFDVEELPTHGASLRIYAKHAEDESKPISAAVEKLLTLEYEEGLHRMETYQTFSDKVVKTKRQILDLLIRLKNEGKSIVGYGAPAKGNTLLNYCGVGRDFFDYVVDKSPHKQGMLLPGTLIPVYAPDHITETKPDIVVIMPWNIKEEIVQQMGYIDEWNGQFVVFIPEPRVLLS
ncbi:class I SAM-dependent methyltransferase [Alicyclobacillus dauci]|uniref:Class I SAM-dependent methyltransferase n=1 Tax=Alicyclobacillus dauci TaxID=1475485 RepID=A0ABY6Z4A5_9BACL|nr:class I SAM-dependent methyltransferase [Alicyclobacillus dauci]WAH37695.1 class I SAM-dependent methyltransferase [Alicyclobacillus dauci]